MKKSKFIFPTLCIALAACLARASDVPTQTTAEEPNIPANPVEITKPQIEIPIYRGESIALSASSARIVTLKKVCYTTKSLLGFYDYNSYYACLGTLLKDVVRTKPSGESVNLGNLLIVNEHFSALTHKDLTSTVTMHLEGALGLLDLDDLADDSRLKYGSTKITEMRIALEKELRLSNLTENENDSEYVRFAGIGFTYVTPGETSYNLPVSTGYKWPTLFFGYGLHWPRQ